MSSRGKYTKSKFVTYSLENEKADFFAKNISFNKNGFASFDVYHNGKLLDNIQLSVPGIHNISNALAAISLCTLYGINISDIN